MSKVTGRDEVEPVDTWFDEPGAAEYLGTKANTLKGWRQVGSGPRFHKLGRRIRYRRSALDEFLTDTEVDPRNPRLF